MAIVKYKNGTNTYRQRVSIEYPVESVNNYGELIKTWTKLCDTWVKIRPLRGREYFSAKQIDSEITIEVVMRYRSDVTEKMRIVFGNRLFNIVSVINSMTEKKELRIMCKEND